MILYNMDKIHGNKGKPRPQWVRDIISKATKKAMQDPKILSKILGSNNSQWKGNKVGFSALHQWVLRHKPRSQLCEICDKKPPYDLANISGQYKRDLDDFQWICRRCHMLQDGRMNNLKQYQGGYGRAKK